MAVRKLYNPEDEPMAQHTVVAQPKPIYGIVANCDRLNVRKNPHRGSTVLTITEEDDTVEIDLSKSTKNWYYVVTESGVEGYSMRDYIVRKK